jgi:NADPH2:quinone reductase
MKALVCTEFGPIEALQVAEVPAPVPGPGQVAIDVEAAAVNFPDGLMVQGKYQFKPQLPRGRGRRHRRGRARQAGGCDCDCRCFLA